MRKKALIVDDTKTELYFLHSLLEKEGLLADEATDVYDALSLLASHTYSLIFVDEFMPVNNGKNSIRLIQDSLQAHKRNAPIILLGENSSEIDGLPVLKKPVEYRRLTEELVRLGVIREPKHPDAAKPKPAGKTSAQKSAQETAGSSPGKKPAPQKTGSAPYEKPPSSVDLAAMQEETPLIPDWLYASSDVDIASGIQFCGSPEGYFEALTIFYRSIPSKAEEIERYLAENDIASYTIKVHALKSSSLLIGAAKLSRFAADLEESGKQMDVEVIFRDTPFLLERLRYYQGLFAPLFEHEETPKDPVPPEVLADAYASLEEFAEQMDIDLMEMVLNSMEDYELPPEDTENMKKISRLLFELDWAHILELLENHHG